MTGVPRPVSKADVSSTPTKAPACDEEPERRLRLRLLAAQKFAGGGLVGLTPAAAAGSPASLRHLVHRLGTVCRDLRRRRRKVCLPCRGSRVRIPSAASEKVRICRSFSFQRSVRLAGARPRRMATTGRHALTPAERRVAELAAEGMRHKEIAQALFVTLRTVEMHLSNTYRKLEISSRNQLPTALGADP
jgi:DNA-binding CsgD family transcriptional regulator